MHHGSGNEHWVKKNHTEYNEKGVATAANGPEPAATSGLAYIQHTAYVPDHVAV